MEFALGEILFAELMKLIPPPPCVQQFHKGLCDLFCLLSLRHTFQRASILETAFSTHGFDPFAMHCNLFPSQEGHPKALDNV